MVIGSVARALNFLADKRQRDVMVCLTIAQYFSNATDIPPGRRRHRPTLYTTAIHHLDPAKQCKLPRNDVTVRRCKEDVATIKRNRKVCTYHSTGARTQSLLVAVASELHGHCLQDKCFLLKCIQLMEIKFAISPALTASNRKVFTASLVCRDN